MGQDPGWIQFHPDTHYLKLGVTPRAFLMTVLTPFRVQVAGMEIFVRSTSKTGTRISRKWCFVLCCLFSTWQAFDISSKQPPDLEAGVFVSSGITLHFCYQDKKKRKKRRRRRGGKTRGGGDFLWYIPRILIYSRRKELKKLRQDKSRTDSAKQGNQNRKEKKRTKNNNNREQTADSFRSRQQSGR